MKALHLSKPVAICGPNYFGPSSTITFSPHKESGWWWRMHDGSLVAIDYKIASLNKRRITLESPRQRLEVWEHIGCLRFVGLDAIVIESDTWPPHFGHAGGLWEQLKPHVDEAGYHVPLCGVATDVACMEHSATQNKSVTWCTVSNAHQLTIEVYINYKGLGEYRHNFTVNLNGDTERVFDQILHAPSQGWPMWLRPIQQTLNLAGLGPVWESVNWPQDCTSTSTALHLFALHRIQDILGAMSLVDAKRLPTGQVTSHCAGHRHDLAMIMNLSDPGNSLRDIVI